MRRGRPLSWRHYVVGMRRRERAQALRSATLARAFRIAQTTDERIYTEWITDKDRRAGL